MQKPLIVGLGVGIVCVLALGAVLFGSAGRWDLPMFWAYLAVMAVAVVGGIVAMDPDLIRERVHPGPGGKDYVGTALITLLFVAQHAVAGLDVGRFHWSDTVPLPVQLPGLLATVVAIVVQIRALAVNRFFSSVLRVQTDRGHSVVSDGPYRYVRHPAYASAPFMVVGGGLALGSWLAALFAVTEIIPLVIRTAREDAMLRQQLPGYTEYARRVRYRLLPGVW